ncbi:hypothetical protein SPRG_07130 [Saprolegnia parasitica CBS 223.65]|uniref:Uncharacterized protein n=1 Tax=Saprolegnia parasitica (strain CBS 223.65) TaxID=695850 RepID=A0A067CM07_SAPPC|nr:hypothetical protein SPRG_07130 [Saprolegnia parasitica CBS 223.65]KDO27857.1 hypothetical protein SPRG_07130 [Saprolegnia parasitica CBS 223.65]|eukprot:XP_012201317.1 hypothetical protein SPRG_07130 [Saprolegnia parasitica CBS 223.65]
MEDLSPNEQVAAFTVAGAFAGAAIGSVESVWHIPKLGEALPSFSHQLRAIALRSASFGMISFSYAVGKSTAASIRMKDDVFNPIVGGFAAGIVPGILRKSGKVGLGAGAAIATVMAATEYFSAGAEPTANKWASRYDHLKK